MNFYKTYIENRNKYDSGSDDDIFNDMKVMDSLKPNSMHSELDHSEFEFSTNKLDKIQEIEKEILEIQNETKQIEEQIDKFKQKKYQLDVSKNGLTNEFLIGNNYLNQLKDQKYVLLQSDSVGVHQIEKEIKEKTDEMEKIIKTITDMDHKFEYNRIDKLLKSLFNQYKGLNTKTSLIKIMYSENIEKLKTEYEETRGNIEDEISEKQKYIEKEKGNISTVKEIWHNAIEALESDISRKTKKMTEKRTNLSTEDIKIQVEIDELEKIIKTKKKSQKIIRNKLFNLNEEIEMINSEFHPYRNELQSEQDSLSKRNIILSNHRNDISKLESRLVDLETEMNRNVELQTAKMRLIDTNGQQKDHIQKIKDGIEFFKTLTELYASNESNFEHSFVVDLAQSINYFDSTISLESLGIDKTSNNDDIIAQLETKREEFLKSKQYKKVGKISSLIKQLNNNTIDRGPNKSFDIGMFVDEIKVKLSVLNQLDSQFHNYDDWIVNDIEVFDQLLGLLDRKL